MNKRVFQVLAVVFVISLLLFAGNTASARPNLSFTATQVYWDSPYRIAVEGYFQNTGSQTVTAITYFNLNIYYWSVSSYYPLAQGTWPYDSGLQGVCLRPGEISKWTFYINTGKYPSFTQWRYESYVEYNYLH